MLEIVSALSSTGYDGLLNIDHIPTMVGDSDDWKVGSAWLVGYVKALLATIDRAK